MKSSDKKADMDSTVVEEENDVIEEIAAVNLSLDTLSSAMDVVEHRADYIKAKLLELLNSNKEIRQSLMKENAENAANVPKENNA